ncbi:hypothetical protein CDAR_291521 [Caerostris darwini]|uniref:Uncharacterized protein n=1 Tax=Caerostris darwini TaxID=1538125 RepID=A0AAV4RIP2_9ARAC|nr:hypothetical protein CDAR_291521 [Caerostris darwini]
MTSSHHLQEELRWQVVGRTEDVMKRLVSRYIHQTKKQLRQDGVNEDDLLEIKQDISSLRTSFTSDGHHRIPFKHVQVDKVPERNPYPQRNASTSECVTFGGVLVRLWMPSSLPLHACHLFAGKIANHPLT